MNQQIMQSVYEEHIGQYNFTYEETTPIRMDIYIFTKRFMDIFISGAGLVLALPILIIVILAIKLESPGDAIYKQTRVGKDGTFFNILKLRSMFIDSEKNGPQWAKKNDERVTKVGKFIRKTRVDEIPQLINVLRGEMSMVGPRPERPNFTIAFNQQIPGFIERLQVKPGVTGLAQIMGGYELNPAEKLDLDRKYIENKGIIFDLKILARTVIVVLTGDGAR